MSVWAARLPVLAAAAGIGVFVALTSLPIAGPIIAPDEPGFLSVARALAGRGEPLLAPGLGSYPWGYPVLLAPIAALVGDPGDLYRAVQLLNAALLAGLLVSVAALLRRLGLPPAGALAAGALVACHPSVVTFSHLAFSENLFLPVQVLAALALLALVERGSPAAALGLGAALGASPFVRSIGAATTAAGALVLLALLRRGDRRRPAALALGAAAAAVLAGGAFGRLLALQPYGELSAGERLAGAWAEPGSLGQTLAGQLVSVSLSTWLLLPVVVVGAARLLPAAVRGGRDLRAGEWMVLFAAAAALGMLLISAAFLRPLARADHAIYARYGEGALPLLACAGVFLLRAGLVPWGLVGWGGAAGLVVVAFGARAIDRGPMEVVSVGALFHPVHVWGLRSLPLVAALLGAVLVLLWRGIRRGRRRVIAAALLIHLAAGLEVLVRYHVPGSRMRADQAAFLRRLERQGVEVRTAAVLGEDPEAWGRGLVSWVFPRARIAGRVPPARPDLLLDSKARWAEGRPGYRLVSLQQQGPFAAWLRDGAEGRPGLPRLTLPPDRVIDYRASLDLEEPPRVARGRLHVSARVANRGDDVFPDLGTFVGGPWPIAPVRLGLRFEDAAGAVLARGRLDLPVLFPGDEVSLRGSVAVPAAATGVVLDLVHEGRRWFGCERRYWIVGKGPAGATAP